MATPDQIAANRLNAQKSTGPTTPEGRAAVRLNGIRHGLTAASLILPGESAEDFEALLDSIEAEHQPASPTEVAMVRRIAMATWRLLRAYHTESGFYAIRSIDLKREFKEYRTLNPLQRHAIVVRDDCRRDNALDKISRYESRLERSLDKALRQLAHSRSELCTKMENQSQFPSPAGPTAPSINFE